jgi:hypothetical protein
MTGAPDEFESYRADLEAAERRVAGEIDPGGRALVVAILVFILIATFILPHAGAARGVDVLMGGDKAVGVAVALPHRLFCWLALIFGVGFSMLALVTRRWALAWIALAGSAVASAIGLLAVWSRQTATAGHPGPGIGLIIAWITVILLAFHWVRVVWTRTTVQLAAEAERRRAAVERTPASLLDSLEPPDAPTRRPADG